MKRIALILAVLSTILAGPAHADTLDFTWNSTAWVKSYESPTQFTISGPFTLSGTGTATFADVATGGGARSLTFGGSYGGTFIASGDGTYNGPMTFPTPGEMRNGLGVLTPTSDGFTVVVHRAASGPDAGAAFVGVGSQPIGTGHPSATASEPAVWLLVSAGLMAALCLRSRGAAAETS
jgi:hypothetical protein